MRCPVHLGAAGTGTKLVSFLECNHWSVRPQYVRRHMHAKHPERDSIVQECIGDIKKSNISVTNPCQFCGQGYSRRDAHLRSCVGMFNGV